MSRESREERAKRFALTGEDPRTFEEKHPTFVKVTSRLMEKVESGLRAELGNEWGIRPGFGLQFPLDADVGIEETRFEGERMKGGGLVRAGTSRPLPKGAKVGEDRDFVLDFGFRWRQFEPFALMEVEVEGKAPIYNLAKVSFWHERVMGRKPLLFVHVLTRTPRRERTRTLQADLVKFAEGRLGGGGLVYNLVEPEDLHGWVRRTDREGRIANVDQLAMAIVGAAGDRLLAHSKGELRALQ